MAKKQRFQWDNTTKDTDIELPLSRSAKKRAASALQTLGEKLIALDQAEIISLELPQDMTLALQELAQMTSFEAKRRQKQYIGRLMRELEPDKIAQIKISLAKKFIDKQA